MWPNQGGFPGCSPSALPVGLPGHSLSLILYGQIPVELLVSGDYLHCLVHIHSSSWFHNWPQLHPSPQAGVQAVPDGPPRWPAENLNSCSGFPALGGLHTPSYLAALKPLSWNPLACLLVTLQMEEKSANSKSILKYQKL